MREIRSYRRVFDLERRVYSIDSLRLNPGGVPVRGIVYFAAILAVAVIGGRVPLLDGLSRALPWYVRDLALPVSMATVLSTLRIEGRTFHLAALSLLRFWMGPRTLSGLGRCERRGGRWHLQELLVLPDGSDARLRRMRYTGPGAVHVAIELRRSAVAERSWRAALARQGWRAALILSQGPGVRSLLRGQVILLGPRTRMLVRSSVAQEPSS